MNAKTLEAVTRHGLSLLAAFPKATEKDPIALCKKLRRIEVATHRIMEQYCNGTASMDDADKAANKALDRVYALIGYYPNAESECFVFINRDPRGYALKLDDEATRLHNTVCAPQNRIATDWGGYGLLAPDLT